MIPTRLYRSLSSSSFQTLLKRGFTPTTKSINEFLLFLSEAHQYKFISHFIHQLNHNCIKGNSQTHTIFAWALLKLGEFDEAEHFMKTQFGNSTNSSKARIWDSLIRGFCVDKKDPDKGLSALQDCLRNYGIVPSSFTFSVLIRSFSSQGKMDGAMEVLELMNDDKVRYPFSNFVCSSVIAGFSKIGKPELALEFFENAVNVGSLRPNLVTYTVLVSALFMLGRVDEFSDLVCRMEKEGLALDVVFYSSWICGYLGEGMLMEAFRRYSEMLDKGLSLDTISYTVLIDGFSKEGNIEKTVGFLNKMAQGGLKPNLVTCTAIILGFCRRGKLDEAFTLFRMVEDLGIKADEFIYAVLIDGVCKAGDIGLAYQLLEEMEKKCIIPSIVTYNTLVNGLCKARRTNEANEASKVMVGDAFTYTTLLHGYIGEGNIVGILDVKQRSEDSGVNMDIVMCNVLIRALFMVGAFEDACALYNRMQELDLAADSVTFCTMIDGCCKVGRIEEALEIFDQSRRTLVSSAACYSCMIRGLCKNGMVDVACEIFIELNERGLPLDTRIYMTLMRDIIKETGAEGILNLIRRSQNRGINISSAIFNCAISLLCKRNFLVAAIELLLMAKINCSVLTRKSYYLTIKGLITEGKIQLGSCFLSVFIKEYGLLEPKVWNILLHYLCLKDVQIAHFFFNKKKEHDPTITFPASALKALARHGRALVAYNLFAGFRDNLSAMDVISYSILVDCLCKEGCLVEALELCAFAQKDGITLNIVTYNSVINGLCLQGCLLEACRLFDSLERIDLVPSEITYATLVDNLCKGGYLVDAKRYLKRMIVKGYEPNTHICNSIIYGYCKFGQIEEAFEILKYMEMKSISLDEYTVSALILGYCQRGDMEEALDLFFDCKRKSITPDFLGFFFLIRGLCAKGRMEEARSVLKEMLLCQTILELINKINVEDELESVGTFLVSLCEQGSIKEAVSVLHEIALIIFPARKHLDQYQELQAPPKLSERDELTAVSPRDSLLLERANFIFPSLNEIGKDNMAESCDMQKRTWCHYIDSYHSLTASLCSQGELSEANEVVKEMLANFDGDC